MKNTTLQLVLRASLCMTLMSLLMPATYAEPDSILLEVKAGLENLYEDIKTLKTQVSLEVLTFVLHPSILFNLRLHDVLVLEF